MLRILAAARRAQFKVSRRDTWSSINDCKKKVGTDSSHLRQSGMRETPRCTDQDWVPCVLRTLHILPDPEAGAV
jgi:hypothetical protein